MNLHSFKLILKKHEKIARWVTGIAIIAVILSQVSLKELFNVFSQLVWGAVIANLFIKVLLRLIIAFRWYLILKIQDATVVFRRILATSLAGTAAGSLVPILGADVPIIYAYYRQSGQADSAISSIFVDRLIAVYIMVFMAALIALINLKQFVEIPVVLGLLAAATAVCLVFPLLVYILRRLPRLFPRWIGPRIRNLLKEVSTNIQYYWRHGTRELLFNAVLSFITQLLRILSVYTLALAVGAPGSLENYAVVAPLMFLIMMIPIPAASVGLEQGVFVVMLGFLGVSLELAFAMALINRILITIAILPGIPCILMGWGFEPLRTGAQVKDV